MLELLNKSDVRFIIVIVIGCVCVCGIHQCQKQIQDFNDLKKKKELLALTLSFQSNFMMTPSYAHTEEENKIFSFNPGSVKRIY